MLNEASYQKYEGLEVYLHAVLILALDDGELSTS